jgi:predicted permease
VRDRLGHALRQRWRSVKRRPGVSLVVVLTLGLGIGANTAIFTVVNAVLLRPLAYRDSERLVALFTDEIQKGRHRNPSSPADFLQWKTQCHTLEGMTAAHPWSPVLTGRGQPEPIPALKATPGLFTLLGTKAARGRAFAESDPGSADDVVVLSDRLWRSRFGGDPGIVGQSLTLDGRPYAVAGVMPPGFAFPPFWATDAEMWTPLRLTAADRSNDARFLRVFARLRSGATLAEARAELDVVARRLAAARPVSHSGIEVNVEPLQEPVVSAVRPALLVLAGAVAFVLLIACANVASLLLAQGAGREREVALRAALGAGRGRLVGHALAESVILAVLGGGLGLAIASVGVSGLRRLSPEGFPRLDELGLDARVLGFGLLLSVLAGVAAGVVPALRGSRVDLVSALRAGDRGGQARRSRVHDLLVVGEFALALVLLLGAGLMTRSFLKLLTPEPGFRAAGLLTATVSLSASPRGEPERQEPFFEELLGRLRALPGVDEAALVNHLPIAGDTWGMTFTVEGTPYVEDDPPSAVYRVATADYLRAMGIPLVRGRSFDRLGGRAAADEVLVNQTLARRYFGEQGAVGRRIHVGRPDSGHRWLTVVGTFADTRQEGLTLPVRPEIVFPYSNNPTAWYRATTLLVRTPLDPRALAEAVKREVWAIDPTLPLTHVLPMTTVLVHDVAGEQYDALLLGLFAGVALLLAAVGVYGVMAHAVSRRTAEIGVRMALGAPAARVFASVVGRGLALSATGVALGLLLAAALWRLLAASVSGMLFDVSPTDPLVLGGVPLLLLAVSLVASAVPARRAATVDPLVALRQE